MKFLVKIVILSLSFIAKAQALVVLQYHHISDTTPKITSTSPELFRAHMEYLDRNKINVWSMDKLASALFKGEPLPNKTVVITFDDGYISIFENAWPVLKQKKYPFTIFVNTQHHDNPSKQFMSWQQLKQLSEAGATIGNHSVSHSYLVRQLEGESYKEWRRRVTKEITHAQEIIDGKVGEQAKVFAYPYGEYNSFLANKLKKLNYVAFGQQSGAISPSDHLQILPRFPFGGQYGDLEDFKTKVSSIPFPFFKERFYTEDKQHFTAPILPKGTRRPILELELDDQKLIQKLQCFASGVGSIDVQKKEGELSVIVQSNKPLSGERARYNCTAPYKDNMFHWYSTTFIFPQ